MPIGWVIVAAVGPTLAALLYIHAAPAGGTTQLLYFSTKGILNLLPITCWYWYEYRRGRASATPLARRATTRNDMVLGLATGTAMSIIVWVAYLLLGNTIDTARLAGNVRSFGAYQHYILFGLFLAVINSGLEEYYWRWFVFGRLRTRINGGVAALAVSVAFAAHHLVVLQRFLDNTMLALLFSAGIAAGGFVWAAQYLLTNRLRGVWLSHFLVDVAVLAVGYRLLF